MKERLPYKHEKPLKGWRHDIHIIIWEAETKAGKLFDICLFWLIILSSGLVVFESIPEYAALFKSQILIIEWSVTGFFTLEYILRILTVRHPRKYIFSFWGFIDLISFLPSWLTLWFTGSSHALSVIRTFRLLRVFKILKMSSYLKETFMLIEALKASRRKITVFLGVILSLVLFLGTMMYMIEGPKHGFTSIPLSVYWAIVTLTTVGYGDLTPETPFGKFIASIMMIISYAIIAVPTGIMTAEFTYKKFKPTSTKVCDSCGSDGHEYNAHHCKFCGGSL
jgi:voltage-gated potassium channel